MSDSFSAPVHTVYPCFSSAHSSFLFCSIWCRYFEKSIVLPVGIDYVDRIEVCIVSKRDHQTHRTGKDRILAFAAGGVQGPLAWTAETHPAASAIYCSAWFHRSFLSFFSCRLPFWFFLENLTIKVHVWFCLNAGIQALEQSTIAPGLCTSCLNRQATCHCNHDLKY